MTIRYQTDINSFQAADFKGFFVGWPEPPSEQVLYQILQGVYRLVIACEQEQVVGFIYAISDGQLSAYIPLLEVLPDFQGQGIGQALVEKMSAQLSHLYMVDLCCDSNLKGFYENTGFQALQGMGLRHYSALKRLEKQESIDGGFGSCSQ